MFKPEGGGPTNDIYDAKLPFADGAELGVYQVGRALGCLEVTGRCVTGERDVGERDGAGDGGGEGNEDVGSDDGAAEG